MIDINGLSQNQLWGLQFSTMRYNEDNDASLTPAEYAEMLVKSACDSYYSSLIEFKKKKALEIFDSLSAGEQESLLQQLNVPDIV